MKVDCSFWIRNTPRKTLFGTEAYVTDCQLFDSLWKFANEHLGVSERRDYIKIEVPEKTSQLPIFLGLLKEAGWKPFFGEFLPPELKDSRFEVRRFRHYEKIDREKAEYLTIHRWGPWFAAIGYAGMNDEVYVGKVSGTKWATRYGRIDNSRSPRFVSDQLKAELEAAKLVGLTFLPVLWDHPEKAKGKFWQVSSSITMPRCLLPILNVPDTPSPWTIYDDGGHFPQELVFRRSEVKAIEPFDVALTAPEEEIHCGPNSWPRTLVVSQRFRQIIKKLKLTTAELISARLVADDWQRPLSDHDRLRMDEV